MQPPPHSEIYDETLAAIRRVGQLMALQRGEELAANPWEHAVFHWIIRFRPHAIGGGRVAEDVVRTALAECGDDDLRGPTVTAHIARKDRHCRICGAIIEPGQRYYQVAPQPAHYAPRWQGSHWRLICAMCAARYHLIAMHIEVTAEQHGETTLYRVSGDEILYAGASYDRAALGSDAWHEALYTAVQAYTAAGVLCDWVQVRPGLVYLLTSATEPEAAERI
jgi:hypothetical protein